MKFASASAANGRNQMRERQRRDRAATQIMRARYPQFASLRLDFAFKDDVAFSPAPQVNVMHPPARAYFVFPCPYADCDGEFDLSAPVDQIAREGVTQAAGHLKCCGQRNRDRNGRSPCGLALEYTITALAE
jgi:hypothetical protein